MGAEHLDAALRLALAKAVAEPGTDALLLSPDNGRAGYASLWEAVASGWSFAVVVRSEILAFDFDGEGAAERARRTADVMRNCGLRPVLTESGRSGHRHLFALVLAPCLREAIGELARRRGAGVRKSKSLIRPPGAPHRQGLFTGLLEPPDGETALAWLNDPTGTPQRLPDRISGLVRDGDTEHRYPSRSEVVMAIAVAAVSHGWTELGLYTVLTHSTLKGGAKTQEQLVEDGVARAEQYVARTWAKAQAFATAHPPSSGPADARREIEAIARIAWSWRWTGRSGATQFSVLLAHLGMAYNAGSLIHDAAVRDVAELAAVGSTTTVRKARERLVALGFLEKLDQHPGPELAGTWRVHRPPLPSCAQLTHTRDHTPRDGLCVSLARSALWRWKGLGLACWRTYEHLGSRPRWHRGELEQCLGWHRKTLHSHLAMMERLGLAICDGDGWWTIGLADPDALARDLGVQALGDKQRRRHERERDAWRATIKRGRGACQEAPSRGTGQPVDDRDHPDEPMIPIKVVMDLRWSERWYEREERAAIESGEDVTPRPVLHEWQQEQLAQVPF